MAEQVIASRKTAFNKATKDYKKERKQSLGKKKQNQVKLPLNNKLKMEIKIATLNLCLGLQNKKI